MDFTYDDEQDALRDAVRGLLGKAYSDFEQRRQTCKADPGFSEQVWSQMAEMGLLGLPFSEEDGGVGAGPVEIAIVCQEIGRVIAPEPYLQAVVLAGGLVQACGTPEQRQDVLLQLDAHLRERLGVGAAIVVGTLAHEPRQPRAPAHAQPLDGHAGKLLHGLEKERVPVPRRVRRHHAVE